MFGRLLLLILITISGALAISSFIVQDADECRFETQESSVLSTGTYVFQQIQSLRFDFIITTKGQCLDVPLVYLRDETSISMAGSMTRDTDTIRLFGEIQPGKHLILVVPSTEACNFEMQPQSSLTLELPNCRIGDQLSIDFEPDTTESEAELMTDFVDLLDESQEVPESVSGLLLIDGIRDYVRYDYKTKWENLFKVERNKLRESAYRHIREVYNRMQPFITGDLSQQKEVEATVQAACAHLNSFIENRKEQVDFKTISLSGFIRKWRKFTLHQLPTFPNMAIQRKENHLGQCQASSRTSRVLSPGTYVFRRLLQIQELQSLRFDFQLKSRHASCLDHLPSVLLRDSNTARGVGATSTEAGMIHLAGEIQLSDIVGKDLILSIPSSKTCVYVLVQAFLTLQLPTRVVDRVCPRIGDELPVDIEWEESKVLDPTMLQVIGPEVLQDVQDVDKTVKDLAGESTKIPKSVAGLSLIDGIWNYVRFNYEAKWEELSKDERKAIVHAYRRLQNVYNRLKFFSTGDLTQRSNVEATVRAACEHLNSFISNSKEQVDFQTVLLSSFQKKWIKYTAEINPTSPPEDPSQLPTHTSGLLAIDAIYNYVVYDYQRQWKALSAEERKPFTSAYRLIRMVFLRIKPFRTGDLSDKVQVEATIQAALKSFLPNARINYKTMKLSFFDNKGILRKN